MKLKRTYGTDLTDDELMILDVLFDANDAYESLIKENYASWHNLTYSHNLGDIELSYSMEMLLEREIIDSCINTYKCGKMEVYGLTHKGGKMWETERKPLWDSYCTEMSQRDENTNNWMLYICSPSLEIAKSFLRTAWDMRLYCFNINDVRVKSYKPYLAFNWNKFFSCWYVLSVTVTQYDPAISTDWHLYEINRTWWRTLNEMLQGEFL